MNSKLILPIILGLLLIGSVLALDISSVSVSSNEVSPGEKVSVSLTLSNNLNDDVKDVSIGLNLNGITIVNGNVQQTFGSVPLSPYQSSSIAYIDKIKQDDSEIVNFNLIADSDANSGIYKIPVAITYTVSGTTIPVTKSGIISVTINGKPNIQASTDSAGLIKNQKSDLTIKIINSGLGNAKFLSVQIGSINNAKIVGSDNFYIGDINKDDFDTIKVSLFVNQNSGSSISVPVTITYKDSTNKEYTLSNSINVKTYTQQEAINVGLISPNNSWIILLIIIILIVAYIVYRSIRKKLRNNKLKE